MTAGRLIRVAETRRPVVVFELDGARAEALQGDTVLVAVLTNGGHLRQSEFGDGNRAGFCLMGACQDCWMWTADGGRLRACSTPIQDGLRLTTQPPSPSTWPNLES